MEVVDGDVAEMRDALLAAASLRFAWDGNLNLAEYDRWMDGMTIDYDRWILQRRR